MYASPASAYVARFVGDANILPVEVLRVGPGPRVDVELAGQETSEPAGGEIAPGAAQLVLRTEHIVLRDGAGLLQGRVVDRAFRGTRSSYLLEVPELASPLRAEVAAARLPAGEPEVGAVVGITWDPECARLILAEEFR